MAKNSIPKIFHQIWIGDASKAPTKLMATWRDALAPLGFRYMFWDEAEIERQRKENAGFDAALALVATRIEEMEEMCGKADILRWVILQEYGGVYSDADSVCIEPIDDHLLGVEEGGFSCFENERVRGAGWSPRYKDVYSHKHALINNNFMGFPPQHPLVVAATRWIKENPVSMKATGVMAWRSTGPGLFTRLYYDDYARYKGLVRVFPSHYSMPIHYTGVKYGGHGRVYAHHMWGSTKNSYATMDQKVEVPSSLRDPPPDMWVSILISSYNTRESYVKECLDSIRAQVGPFGMEVVWINDGSTETITKTLKRQLVFFEKTCRFVRVKYVENVDESGQMVNRGIGFTLNRGVTLCSHDLIVRMDSDDVMVPNRIEKQLQFMRDNKGCKIVSAQLEMFSTDAAGKTVSRGKTNHPTITWQEYVVKRNHWFVNHAPACFRKSAALEAGNYPLTLKWFEDFDFLMRMLKKFGVIHHMPDVLYKYRLHENQVTKNNTPYWYGVRNRIIEHHLEGEECVPYVHSDGARQAPVGEKHTS